MHKQNNLPKSSTLQSEDKTRITQLKTIFEYLQKNVATASMVTAATGIAQKCATRYKRDLELSGRLWEIERTQCKATGFKAWYITTDPKKAPIRSLQLNLFPTDPTITTQVAEGLKNGL